MSFKDAILKNLKPEKVRLMLDQEMDTLDQYLLDHPTKIWSPMLLIKVFRPKDAKFDTIAALPPMDDKRHDVMEALGKRMAQDKHMVLAVILLSEVWYVETKEGDKMDLPPSKHPDRMSAMCVSMLTIDGQSHARMFKTKYNSKGHIAFGESLVQKNSEFRNILLSSFYVGFLGEIKEKLYQ